MKKITTTLISATALLCTFLIVLPAQAADDWNFVVEPYLLISSIDGDAGVGRVTGAEVEVDFSDILDTLEIGGMIHLEAFHESGWGLLLDYAFMDLGDDLSGPLGGIIDVDVHQGVLELLAARRLNSGEGHIEIFAGIRWWDNDVDVVVDPAVLLGDRTASIDQDWVDPVIGARFTMPMADKWKLVLRGDVGGFGAGSDFTAVAAGGILYSFNQTISLDVQYKALWVDYEDGTRGTPGYFAYDTVTHGPLVGLKFEF
jgi:hypothetical protein